MKERRSILYAFLIFASILVSAKPSIAQQYQVVYPNGKVAISEKPLPPPVYESQKNILVIEGEFFSQNNPNLFSVWQTGFMDARSGYIISARHGLVETAMTLLGRYGLDYKIDGQGILRGVGYDYRFYALTPAATSSSTRETATKRYPLSVVAMGPMGTDNDVIVFKSTEKILAQGLEMTTKAAVGETVYFSGFTKSSLHFHDPDGETVYVTFQNLKFNVESIIVSMFENVRASKVKRTYLLTRSVKGGFSGGPILNKAGKVIAMGIATDEMFSYAISSQDISTVLSSIKK